MADIDPQSTPEPDPLALGRALNKLRTARGYTQKQVADRISTRYSEAGSYGRIERGERTPDRDALIDILSRGLLIREIEAIDAVLPLGGYERLTAEEITRLGLVAAQKVPPVPPPAPTDWRAIGSLAGIVVLGAVLSVLTFEHWMFTAITASLYGVLYAVSLYLETAYADAAPGVKKIAIQIFALMSASSVAALAIDRALIGSHHPLALPAAFAVFLLAAIAQFVLSRRVLPASPLVPLSFQSRTAQGAHLKNTVYFMLFVVLCWLPSFHCVLTFERELREGRSDWVMRMSGEYLIAGRGVVALNPTVLGITAVIALTATWIAGSRLLDDLKPSRHLNAYTNWYYVRALIYVLLCVIVIGWYFYAFSELP